MTCTAQDSPLKTVRLQKKNFKSNWDFNKFRTHGLAILIHRFVLYNILFDDPKEAVAIKRKVPRFCYNAITWTLYRRSPNAILLRCFPHKEAHEAFREAQNSTCRANQPKPKLGDRLQTTGLLLAQDDFWCHCLYQAMSCLSDLWWLHTSSTRSSSSNVFYMAVRDVKMDIIGLISPPTSKGHRFMFAITDYFSK